MNEKIMTAESIMFFGTMTAVIYLHLVLVVNFATTQDIYFRYAYKEIKKIPTPKQFYTRHFNSDIHCLSYLI